MKKGRQLEVPGHRSGLPQKNQRDLSKSLRISGRDFALATRPVLCISEGPLPNEIQPSARYAIARLVRAQGHSSAMQIRETLTGKGVVRA